MTGFDPAHELPHARDGSPLWAESYLSYTFSPDAGVGTWLHLAHLPGSADLWETVLLIALPGGELAAARTVAPGRIEQGVVTAGATMRCQEPYAAWTVSYRGGARRLASAALRTAPLRDGHCVQVELALRTTSAGPPYDYGRQLTGQGWATGHIEQHERCTGTLAIDGEETELRGVAWRDHSWGPRDFTRFGEHVFCAGQLLDSGHTFTVAHLRGDPPSPPVLIAAAGDGHAIGPATVVSMPTGAELEGARDVHAIELSVADADGIQITVEPLSTLPLAFVGASEIAVGGLRPPDAHHLWMPSFARLRWNGQTGYGCVEHSRRL